MPLRAAFHRRAPTTVRRPLRSMMKSALECRIASTVAPSRCQASVSVRENASQLIARTDSVIAATRFGLGASS